MAWSRYAPRRLAGIALAFAGVVVVVVLGPAREFSLHGLRGPLLVLVAPLTFAVYNILYKPLLGRFDLPALTAAGGLTGSLLFLPFENTGAIDRFGALDAGSWIALAALGLGATLGGYVTWSIALRGLEPSRAMSYLYLRAAAGRGDRRALPRRARDGLVAAGRRARDRRGRGRATRACTKDGDAAECLHRRRREATMVTLRKRLMLAGGVAALALLALPTLVSANPGTGPELVQRSGRLVVVHADRYDGSSTQQWRLVAGATSLPVRAPADVWIDPGTRVRLEGTMRDGTLVLADSVTAVVRAGLSPLQDAAATAAAAPSVHSTAVILVSFQNGPTWSSSNPSNQQAGSIIFGTRPGRRPRSATTTWSRPTARSRSRDRCLDR